MILNALLIALREIRRNLTRSFLTVVGIVIGVAAVITMVTLGRGATETVKQQISKMGSNLLIVRPGQGWGSWGAPQFNMNDVNALRDQVPGIASLAPLVKITSPSQPSAALIRQRAPSSAARAARPAPCGLDGLAQSSNPRSIASRAAGSSGVVAAWSR